MRLTEPMLVLLNSVPRQTGSYSAYECAKDKLSDICGGDYKLYELGIRQIAKRIGV